MSRMWPAYIDHTESLQPFSPSGLWLKYHLYLYRERTVEPMDIPTGSPALFVPGNAGSYAQVRSVASSAAKQYYRQGSGGAKHDEWINAPIADGHTDWWTVDFNEDFSAFSQSMVVQQATFLNEVVAFLRTRYPSPSTKSLQSGERNTSVPILAHSMGGISARLMTQLDNHPPASVDTIVTLSTPHAFPPVPFDKSMESVYNIINRQPAHSSPLIVSVAGGLLDTQLPSDLSSLSLAGIYDDTPSSRISTYTSSLPSLWSSVDHLAIMWCDQMREKVARGFLLDAHTFGRLSEERNAPSTREVASGVRRRREMWRRVLGIAFQQDGANGELGPVEFQVGESTDQEEVRVDSQESPTLHMDVEGEHSVLQTNASNSVYHLPARMDADPENAFELITNLCVGSNPSAGTGPPIGQPVELIVLMCSRSPNPVNPTAMTKANCELVLPWRWQMMPPSELPSSQSYPPDFPDAHVLYHVPGQSYKRLRLDSRMLREKQIEFIRVERRANDGLFVGANRAHSFVWAAWVKELAGEVEAWGQTTELRLSDDNASPELVQEWSLPSSIGSALEAYEIELVPSKCFLKNVARNMATLANQPSGAQHPLTPAFAPAIRVSHPATGDSRWYPSLVPSDFLESLKDAHKAKKEYVMRLPLTLHGASPFMPPLPASQSQVHLQLWSDPALLRQSNRPGKACSAAFEAIRIRRNVRASVGLIVLRYRFFIAAWPLAILGFVIAKMWHDWMASTNYPDVFPSLLNYLTKPWCVKRLLLSSMGLPIVADLLQRFAYRAITSHRSSHPLVGMIIGMPQPAVISIIIIPCLAILSYSFLLVVSFFLHHGIGLTVVVLTRLGLDRKLDWGSVDVPSPQGSSPRFKASSVAGIAGLLVSIMVLVPYQFVFVVVLLLHWGNTIRSRIAVNLSPNPDWHRVKTNDQDLDGGYTIPSTTSRPTNYSAAWTRYNQYLLILTLLLLLLPQKATVLVVWARNLASVGLVTPKTSASWTDHNILDIAPILFMSWIFADGRALEKPRTLMEGRVVVGGFAVLGIYGFAWGIRHAYRLYDVVNWVTAVLVVVHWRSRTYGPGVTSKYEAVPEGRREDQDIAMLKRQSTTISSSTSIPIDHMTIPASAMVDQIAAPTTATSEDSKTVAPDTEALAPPSTDDPPRLTDLDALLEEYLDLIETYQQARTCTSQLFSAGFLQLSKAKMEFGHKRIGPDAYDTRLLAEVRFNTQTLTAERFKPDYSKLLGELMSAKKEEDGVRQRRSANTTKTEKEPLADTSDGKEKPRKKTPSLPDALFQFVGMPSPVLRSSQREFKMALDKMLGVGRQEGVVQILARVDQLKKRIRELRVEEGGTAEREEDDG